jgi:hypothetical protein
VGHQTSSTQVRSSKRVAISWQHGSSNETELFQLKVKQINGKHDSQSHLVAQTIRSTSRLGLTTRLKETRRMAHRTTRQNGQGYDRREWTSVKWESELGFQVFIPLISNRDCPSYERLMLLGPNRKVVSGLQVGPIRNETLKSSPGAPSTKLPHAASSRPSSSSLSLPFIGSCLPVQLGLCKKWEANASYHTVVLGRRWQASFNC